MFKTAYAFDPVTKEYTGETIAQQSPLEPDVILVPANATITPPIDEASGKAIIWSNDAWSHVDDNRGLVYEKLTRNVIEFTELGLLPDIYTKVAPSTIFDQWDGKKWVLDIDKQLVQLKDDKRREVRSSYDAACLLAVPALSLHWNGGFDSAIKLDAAMRLSETVGLSAVTFFDIGNTGHSLSFSDALQVVIAVSSAFQQCLAKKQSLMLAIESAVDPAALDLVVWD